MDPPSLSSLSLETEPLTLMRLPTELLESIADELPQKARIALAKVNKRLGVIAQRAIFDTVEIPWGTLMAPLTVGMLLFSIQNNPQLANLVRTLTFLTPEYIQAAYYDAEVYTHHLNPSTIKKWVKKLKFDESYQLFLQKTRAGDIEAIVPVLAAQLPHLETLHISGPITERQTMLGIAMTQSHTIARETGKDILTFPYASIKTVVFDITLSDKNLDIMNSFTAMGFFFLPRIEDLAVHIPYRTPATWPALETATPTKLKYLKIEAYRKDDLGANTVKMIIKACPALYLLRYTTIWHSNDPAGLDLTELSSVVREATGPIRALAIYVARVPTVPVQTTSTGCVVTMIVSRPLSIDNPETFVTGELSLSSMLHVSWLYLTWVHVFGMAPGTNLPLSHSTFPPGMTHLTISSTALMNAQHNFWGLFDRVREARDFVSVCSMYAPRLVKITFGSRTFNKHTLEDRIKRDLRRAAEPSGVEVDFDPDCFFAMSGSANTLGEEEKMPDDWQWLVPDEEQEDDGVSMLSDVTVD